MEPLTMAPRAYISLPLLCSSSSVWLAQLAAECSAGSEVALRSEGGVVWLRGELAPLPIISTP